MTIAGGAAGIAECFIDKEFTGNEKQDVIIGIDGSHKTAFWLLFGNGKLEIELFCRRKSDSGWEYDAKKQLVKMDHTFEELVDDVKKPLSNMDRLNPAGKAESGSLGSSQISTTISPGERYQIGIRAKCVSAALGMEFGFIPNSGAASMLSTDTDLGHSKGMLKSRQCSDKDEG